MFIGARNSSGTLHLDYFVLQAQARYYWLDHAYFRSQGINWEIDQQIEVVPEKAEGVLRFQVPLQFTCKRPCLFGI